MRYGYTSAVAQGKVKCTGWNCKIKYKVDKVESIIYICRYVISIAKNNKYKNNNILCLLCLTVVFYSI